MSSPSCSIYLTTADNKYGVPLIVPGCCGARFHRGCIDNVIAAGGRNCPMCRQVLPNFSVGNAASAEPGPVIGGIFSQLRWRRNDRNRVPASSYTIPIHESKAPSSIVSAPEDDGMITGWTILENRKTKNPASCMFLLTDGQDMDNLDEKLYLARKMKSEGTSLFVFGFGTDHDSEHMDAIANAAEGVFTYVESDNMVTDAFGGTIGAQQGQSLSNITLSLQACERDVRIIQVLSGRYMHNLDADNRTAQVDFVNLFLGERREVLLRLKVPAVAWYKQFRKGLRYELIRATATFRVQGETAAVPLREAQLPATCVVQRLSADRLNPALTRDMEVDVQLNRFYATAAVGSALKDADAGRMDAARATLTSARIVLLASVSHQAKHLTALSLLQGVDDALSRVQSRTEYDRGGRAMMQECVSSNAYQRSVYNKAGHISVYQTSYSASMQQQAADSTNS